MLPLLNPAVAPPEALEPLPITLGLKPSQPVIVAGAVIVPAFKAVVTSVIVILPLEPPTPSEPLNTKTSEFPKTPVHTLL